ncbi:MAG TPA: hypothetical protein VMS17_33830, partial [Gemmataceae bacterium]|nr:hypothetical protein [Gemmataceae bacterium]
MLCQRTSRRKTATKKVRITTARPRLELLEDRCLLSATPLTFAPVNPLGSLVYEGSVSNAFISPGTTDSYTFTINAGQTLAAVVTPQSAGLQPSFQILNSSNQVVGGGTASAAGSAALQQVISAAGGAYTVNVAGASNTTGMYTIQVYLNAAIDSGDNGGASNNTLATAQDLTDSLETLSNGIGSATRADVVGSVGNGAVIINAADAGSYDETGFHDSASKQYISGLLSTPPSFTTYNDYFVFDLSGVAAGTVINGAELVLANQGSASPNSSDTWTVYDVSTPIAALEASNSGRT